MYKKIAIKNISTSFMWQSAAMLSGLILPGMIINHYGSEINGLIASITSFLSYIAILDSGLAGVIKADLYQPLAHKNWENVSATLNTARLFFRKIAGLFLIYLMTLLIFLPKLIQTSLSPLTCTLLIISLSFSLFFEYYSGLTNRLLILADKRNAFYNVLQTGILLLNLVLTLFLIQRNQSITLVKLVTSLIFLMNPLILAVYVKRTYPLDPRIAASKSALRQKWDGVFHHLANLSRNNVDILLLTLFFSVREVSIYSVYLMIVNVLSKLIAIFTNGVEAFFGELIALKKMRQLEDYFSFYQFWYTTIVFVFCITASIVVFPFLTLYIHNAERQGYIRPAFMFLLFAAQIFFLLRVPFSNIVFSAGRYKETKKIALLEVAINVLLSISCLFLFGMTGLAFGTLMGTLAYFIQMIFFIRKHFFNSLWLQQIKQVLLFFGFSLLLVFCAQFFPFYASTINQWFILSTSYLVVITSLFLLFIKLFFPKKIIELQSKFFYKYLNIKRK